VPAPGSGSATGAGSGTPGFGRLRDADAVAELPSDGKPEEPETVDVGKAIADLGAVPAWQAVVDRAQYLARRGQHGVVFGTLGLAASTGAGGDAGLATTPGTWLVDDTEGNGALAIRVELGRAGDHVKQNDRVALGGAWTLDDQRRWYWRVDAATPLPAAPPANPKDGPASAPGHTILDGRMPPGSKPISKAGDGDWVYFQLVGAPPAIDGDGWPVADELESDRRADQPSRRARELRCTGHENRRRALAPQARGCVRRARRHRASPRAGQAGDDECPHGTGESDVTPESLVVMLVGDSSCDVRARARPRPRPRPRPRRKTTALLLRRSSRRAARDPAM
jgi:hypothetical protein